MRKFNGILARVVVVLFLIHAMMGCFMLQGRSSVSCFPLTILLLVTVIAHAILGVIATIKSVRSGGISGKWYLKQNKGILDQKSIRSFHFTAVDFSYERICYFFQRSLFFEGIYLDESGLTAAFCTGYFYSSVCQS